MTTQTILRKRVQYHVKRLADPLNKKIYEKTRTELSSCLVAPFLPQMMYVAARLDRLATWYATSGLDQLSRHEVGGWNDIHRALRYQVLAARIAIHRSFTFAPPANEVHLLQKYHSIHTLPYASNISLCAAYTGVHQLPEHRFLCEHLLRAIAVSDPSRVSSLAWFIAWLYKTGNSIDRVNGEVSTSVIKANLRNYSSIQQSWEFEKDFEVAAHEICDYHCQRIWSVSYDLTDFSLAPFDMVPYEILFMIYTRSQLSLGTPSFSHPLLATEFAKPNFDLFPDDELYDLIYKKIAEFKFL